MSKQTQIGKLATAVLAIGREVWPECPDAAVVKSSNSESQYVRFEGSAGTVTVRISRHDAAGLYQELDLHAEPTFDIAPDGWNLSPVEAIRESLVQELAAERELDQQDWPENYT